MLGRFGYLAISILCIFLRLKPRIDLAYVLSIFDSSHFRIVLPTYTLFATLVAIEKLIFQLEIKYSGKTCYCYVGIACAIMTVFMEC